MPHYTDAQATRKHTPASLENTTPNLEVEDGRSDLPIFIHSDLDDLPLSLEAFRVYAHLARRAGKDNRAWPSYNSMGEACFRKSYPNAGSETLRRKAIAAIKELTTAGLIRKVLICNERGEHATNRYRLTPRHEWGGSVNALGSVNTLGSVNAPKGTPLEGTPLEGTPEEGREAAAPPSVRPSSFSEPSLPSINEKGTQANQPARAPSPPVAVAPPSPTAQVDRAEPIGYGAQPNPYTDSYRDILGLTLSPADCEQILRAAPKLPDYLVTLRVWKAADYNPTNVAGILELAADPRRARWKLAQLEKGEDAPKSYQVDINSVPSLPFVPDTPPVDAATWVVQDDPLTTIWRNCCGELGHFSQLKDSCLLAAPEYDGIPVYVVQVGDERDAQWLKVQAPHVIKRALKAQIEGDFILEIAA